MRQLKTLELTNVLKDKFGNYIGFAIEPDTGTSYFISTMMVERYELGDDTVGVEFKAYCNEPKEGTESGQVQWISKDSLLARRMAVPAPVEDEADMEAMDALLGEMDAGLVDLIAAIDKTHQMAQRLRAKLDAVMED